MPTRKFKLNWLLLYLIGALIGLASLDIFFAISGMSLTWGFDGYAQHYTTAVYAKTFWSSILSGQGIPMYEFIIGEGGDGIISTLYYGLTEPWSVLYAFIPTDWIFSFFEAFLMIRLLLSGVFFGLYARKYSDNRYAIATASLCYAFSGWFTFWIQAPNLITAGMLFPLLLYSMDIAFDKKKYTPLLLTTALMYICNYYMGMTTSFLLLAYAILRIIMSKQWNKEAWIQYFKTAGAHLVGILTSCAVLIPVVIGILESPRLNGDAGYSASLLVYNFQYYVKALCQFAVPNLDADAYWGTLAYQMHLNFFPIAAIATVLFLQTKTEPGSVQRRLKWSLLLCTVFMCVPFFGKLFNAWSYPTQRWGLAMSICVSLIVLWYIPRIKEAKSKTYLIALIWVWCGVCLNYYIADTRAAYTAIAVTLILTALTFIKLTHLRAYVATTLAVIMVFFSSYIAYPYAQTYNTNLFYVRDNPFDTFHLTQEEYDSLTRVANDSSIMNANNGILSNVSTTSVAWNVSHSSVMYYNNNMQSLSTACGDWVLNSNYRPAIVTLAGVKYYSIIEKDAGQAPLGFEEIYKEKLYGFNSQFVVFENQYNPGIGYMMQDKMSLSEFQKLDIAAKQIALMKYAIVEEEGYTQTVPSLSIPYTITEDDITITLTFEAPAGYDIYLYFDNAQPNSDSHVQVATYERIPPAIGSLDSNDNAGGLIAITTDETGYSYEQSIVTVHRESIQPVNASDKSVHIGSNFKGVTTITLNSKQVELDLTDIALYGYHENDYYAAAEYLCNNNMQNVYAVGGAHPEVTGTINVQQAGVMQLAIPYSNGWSVYVDGEKADVFLCGGKYMGIELTEGQHDIQMKYRTPGIIPGLIISAAAGILALAWLVYEWREKLKWLLTESKHSTICRFLIAGCCTTALDFIIYLCLLGINIPVPLSKFCSITISAVVSFIINKYWSFKKQNGNIATQGIKFAITQGANIGVNVATNSLLLSLSNVTIVAFIGATLCGMIVNFALQKFWVFQSKEETA